MRIIADNCVGCGHCIPFCPQGAISVNGTAYIDDSICVNCVLCMEYCPNLAIEEDKP